MLRCPVADLESRVTQAEFTHWVAFDSLWGLPDTISLAQAIFQMLAAWGSEKSFRIEEVIPYLQPSPAEREAARAAKLEAAIRFFESHVPASDSHGATNPQPESSGGHQTDASASGSPADGR